MLMENNTGLISVIWYQIRLFRHVKVRLDRTMAWCLRFGYNCRHQKIKKRRLNARRDGCRPGIIHPTRSRDSFPAGSATLEKKSTISKQLETIQPVRGRQETRRITSGRTIDECTGRLRNSAPNPQTQPTNFWLLWAVAPPRHAPSSFLSLPWG